MKKYLIGIIIILTLTIVYLIRFIYIDNVKSLDNDLLNTEMIIFHSHNQYIRNGDSFPFEEYKSTFNENSSTIGYFVSRHLSKNYLPKYKIKLLQDIDSLMQHMNFQLGTKNRDKLVFETIDRIDIEMRKMIDKNGNTIQIGEEEYTRIHNIIIEYKTQIEGLPKE